MARCAVVALLSSVAAYACSDAVHTVGQLETAPALGGPPRAGSSAGSNSGSSGDSGGLSGSGASSGGNSASASGNAGSGPPVLDAFDAAVITDPGISCEGGAEDAVRERLDLYLIIDRNVSLAVPWNRISDGLVSYVEHSEAAGTGVGVSYFPALDSAMQPMCDADTYVTPDTPIELLPGNAAAIKAGRPSPLAGFTGSPTSAALEGALQLSASRRNGFQVPQAVVLMTDAVQDFVCFTEPRELETVAAAARNGAAAIPTYVVALTVPELQSVLELLGFVPLNNLDAVAASGGTSAAREVGLNLASPIEETIASTLLSIQHDAEPCRYEVPAALGMALDAGAADAPTTVLGTVVGADQPLALPHLGAESECGQGYYFDDPAAPQWATLCEQTCSAVKMGRRRVQWLTECMR